MSDALPEPPVPPDADLKDFAFTPIYRARLFGSAFHSRSSDAEWRAGVTLWLKSQDQVPAGSLPDDDVELCRLAELGRDMKTWRKIRPGALRGWYRCSDGRLYHDVVAEVVNLQWGGKAAQRNRTAAARAARLSQRQSGAKSQNTSAVPSISVTDRVTSSKGEGEGEREGKTEQATAALPAAREAAAVAAPPFPEASEAPEATEHRARTAVARGLIEAFDRLRSAAFGEHRARPWPAGTDLETALAWLRAGGDPPGIEAVLEGQMTKMAGQGKAPPNALRFFDADVRAAIERGLTDIPVFLRKDGGGPSPAAAQPEWSIVARSCLDGGDDRRRAIGRAILAAAKAGDEAERDRLVGEAKRVAA